MKHHHVLAKPVTWGNRHTVALNVSQTVNVALTWLASIRSASIHASAPAELTRNAELSAIHRNVFVRQDTRVTHSINAIQSKVCFSQTYIYLLCIKFSNIPH